MKKLTPPQRAEKLRKRCVTLAKRLARVRDKFTCQYCLRKEPQVSTHGSHIYAEGTNKSMSADVDNILAICAQHHMVSIYWKTNAFSWHGTPKEAIEWFDEKYPELSKTLKERSRNSRVMMECDWEQKWQELKELEKKLSEQ